MSRSRSCIRAASVAPLERTPAHMKTPLRAPAPPAQSILGGGIGRGAQPPSEAMRAGFVALIGRPNAGKSTLLNRLVGEKMAIVSPRPQTTRNRITGIRNLPGAQIVFVDTPGLHPAGGKLGEFMSKTVERALEDVGLICVVVDPPGRQHPDQMVLETVRAHSAPAFCLLNKADE